jgi:hypothetical protein
MAVDKQVLGGEPVRTRVGVSDEQGKPHMQIIAGNEEIHCEEAERFSRGSV